MDDSNRCIERFVGMGALAMKHGIVTHNDDLEDSDFLPGTIGDRRGPKDFWEQWKSAGPDAQVGKPLD